MLMGSPQSALVNCHSLTGNRIGFYVRIKYMRKRLKETQQMLKLFGGIPSSLNKGLCAVDLELKEW
jgi:hypothetical protein